MKEISPGVYVETDQRGANYGGIVTAVGTLVIDTPMVPSRAETFAMSSDGSRMASHFYTSSIRTTTAAIFWATSTSCPHRWSPGTHGST